jgi:hypothetical protein
MLRIVDRGLLRIALVLALVALLAWAILWAVRPVATGSGVDLPRAGAVQAPANAVKGVDLVCSGGKECGPSNPATKVAPSVAPGAKVEP